MKINLIARHEELLTHIEEVIGIIQNDCAVIDSDQDIPIFELRLGFAHIQGLCNGLQKRIEGFNNEP